MKNVRMLIVDKNLRILGLIGTTFNREGWLILSTAAVNEVIDIIDTHMPDLVVINAVFPGFDHLQLCYKIRECSNTIIIVITPQYNSEEKVKCLNIGVDEYLVQSDNPDELIAHIRAVIRRSYMINLNTNRSKYFFGDIVLDSDSRSVRVGTKEVRVTPTEYTLLQELIANAGKVCSHSYLLGIIWGSEYKGEKHYLHTYIKRLRAKIEPEYENPQYIITVPGIGYYLKNTK